MPGMIRVIALTLSFLVAAGNARGADSNHLAFQQMGYGDWLIYHDDGTADGVFAVIMKAIAKDAGINLSFHNVPFKRTITEVGRGKKVLTGYMVTAGSLDPSFSNLVTLAPMLEKVEYGVTLRKGLTGDSYKDLEGLRISYFQGASPEPGLTDNPAIKITLTRNLTQAVKMFQANRIDGIWADYYGLDGAIAKLNGVKWEDMFETRILSRTGVPAIVVHKDFVTDSRVMRIKQSAEKLYNSGQLETLAKGWFRGQRPN